MREREREAERESFKKKGKRYFLKKSINLPRFFAFKTIYKYINVLNVNLFQVTIDR